MANTNKLGKNVSTLNEINSFHVNYLYGRHQFTENDALVTYEDFMTFYNLLNSCTNKKQSQQQLALKSQQQQLTEGIQKQLQQQQQKEEKNKNQENTRKQFAMSTSQECVIQRPPQQMMEYNRHPEIINRLNQQQQVQPPINYIHHIHHRPVFIQQQQPQQQHPTLNPEVIKIKNNNRSNSPKYKSISKIINQL